MRYRFGEHELDPDAYVLRHAGRELALQPKMLDLLRYLIEQRERVVSKEELLQALWPGEHVNDSAVAWTVSHVRTALGQGRGEKRPIETIHGRGYRFRADVTTETAGIQPAPEQNSTAAAPTSTPPARGRPFVGRVEVMRRLETLLAEAKQGRGRLCLLSGEAGIGKTRAAEELMSRAEHRGMSIWLGRAVEDASAPVLWPFVQVLRKIAAERPALRAECEPLLQRLVALEVPREKGSAERNGTGRFLLMDEVTRVLLRACAQTPALIVLDDLQWADSSTLDLLAFLTPELSRAHLLVVGTLRPSEDPRIQRIARKSEHIHLALLTAEDIGEYITAIVQPSEENPERLAAAMHRATSGNPLFVQETLRALIAEHGARLLTRQPGEIAPPDVARNVLRSRLETLDATACTLLASASVLGEAFELPILQAVTGAEPSALLDALEAAGQIGFAAAETPQRYRFAHALIRQVLYDGLPMPERVALHRKAALALEAVRSAESHSAEIAHHFYRSLALGDHGAAADACLRAAAEAEALYAYEDAARLYSWALEAQALDPNVSPRSRAAALLRAGTAQRHAGREGGGKRALGRMFELAREHGFADLIVRGVRALRPTYAMASVPDPSSREALEAVLNMQPAPALESRVLAMAQLSCIPPYSLDMKKSEELSGKALELARSDAPELVPEAMRARLYSLSGPDHIDQLLAMTDEMLSLNIKRVHLPVADAFAARAGALIYRGDIVGADREIEALGQAQDARRLPEGQWYYERLRVQRKAADGHLQAAVEGTARLRSQAELLGLSYGPWFVDALDRVLTLDLQGAKAMLAKMSATETGAQASAVQPVNIRARMARGAAELGATAMAREALDAIASEGFSSIAAEISYLGTLANLGLAAAILRDQARAEQLYALLLPYAHFNTPNTLLMYEGSVSRFLGHMAACLGRDDRVSEHFDAALEMNKRMGARPLVARTLLEHARWLKKQSSTSAQARGRELAAQAAQLAESIGMAPIAHRARSLFEIASA